MKICFVMATPFTFGGEQRVVSVIASLLQEKGHQVTILCTDKKTPINYNTYNLNKDVKIVFTGNRTIDDKIKGKINYLLSKLNTKLGIFKKSVFILKKISCDMGYKRSIKEIVEKEKFDVVIGVAGYFSLLLATINFDIKVKKIGWQHNCFETYFRNKYRYYWNQEKLFRKLVAKLDEYVVLTNYDRDRIKEEWNIECKTIYNPKSFTSNKISTLEDKTFLAAGRFVYAKGFDNLIEAFNIFSKKNKGWNLNIVGTGEEEEKLKNLIKEYELEERVKLQPFTDNIMQYFLYSSALLLSSRWEGMPMIMLESLEMGVPIIAYDIPVVEEIIQNREEGIVVKQGDIEQYARALEEYAENKEMREEMGRKAKILSNQFSSDKILREWEEILN